MYPFIGSSGKNIKIHVDKKGNNCIQSATLFMRLGVILIIVSKIYLAKNK